MRKCYNSLKRDNLVFTVEVVEKPEAVPEALGHFFRLHAMRAGTENTIRHRDVFDSPASQRFLGEVTQRLAARGKTRIFVLSIQGQVVAIRIGYVFRDSIYLYYSGYDLAWGKYSVMTTVVAEAFKYAMGNGIKTANLSTGNDISKTRWGPSEVMYREVLQVTPSMRSRLALDGYQFAMKAKRHPRVTKWVSRYLSRR